MSKLLFFLSEQKKLKLFLDLEWIFDRLAHESAFKVYPPSEHPVRAYSLDFMRRRINDNSTVCDLGCKQGDISFLIAQFAKEVVGVDFDTAQLELARNTYKKDNLSFVEEEAFSYVQRVDKDFNVLILSHIVEHLDEPVDFLKQAKDLFSDIYIEIPDFDKYYLNYYRQDMGNTLVYTDDDHINEWTREEFQKVLNAAGMKINEAEYRYGIQKLWVTAV